jgi:hypothetical protein
MRPEVQVLPGPLPAMTSENASRRIRGFFRRRCAGSRPLTWLSLLVMDMLLQVSARPRCALPRAARTTPSGPSTTCWVGLASPTLAAQLTPEIETATVQGASAVPSDRRPHPDRARQAYRRGVRWNRDAAPAWPCPPARWVGRNLATRPRAVRPRERPDDAPARGDRHRARLGDRQGPPLHVLAQARRRPSVHPPDL